LLDFNHSKTNLGEELIDYFFEKTRIRKDRRTICRHQGINVNVQPNNSSVPEFPIDDLTNKAKEELLRILHGNRKFVAFTGSGLSAGYGWPDWKQLAKYAQKQCSRDLREFIDALKNVPANPQTEKDLERLGKFEKFFSKTLSPNVRPSQNTGSAEKFVFEVCDAVLLEMQIVLRGISEASRRTFPKVPSSVNELIANVFSDEELSANLWLIERGFGDDPPGDKAPATSQDLQIDATRLRQTLCDPIFLAEQLTDRVGSTPLRIWCPNGLELLTVDQRHHVDLALASFTDAEFESLKTQVTSAALPNGNASESSSKKERVRPTIDPLKELVTALNIQRIITLNYDWEAEKLAMLGDQALEHGEKHNINTARASGLIESSPEDPHFSSLYCRLSNGRLTSSEAYAPRASASLFEFALDSGEFSSHIIHLHGRADEPHNIVSSDSDYNRIYRSESNAPQSLERALDVTLLGNPIIFVGVGLKEPEITRAFQKFVANGAMRFRNPAFALMPPTDVDKSGEENDAEDRREQISHYTKFGLYILYYGKQPPSDGTEKPYFWIRELVAELTELCKVASSTCWSDPIKKTTYDAALEKASNRLNKKLFAEQLKTSLEAFEIEDECKPVSSLSHFLISKQSNQLTANQSAFIQRYLRGLSTRLKSAALQKELSDLSKEFFEQAKELAEVHKAREDFITRIEKDELSPTDGDKKAQEFYKVQWKKVIHNHHFRISNEFALETVRNSPQVNQERLKVLRETPRSVKKIKEILDSVSTPKSCVIVVGATGSGKSTLIRHLLCEIFAQDCSHPLAGTFQRVLVLNFSLALEVESAIDLVLAFLLSVSKPENIRADELISRDRLDTIKRLCSDPAGIDEKSLVVLVGLDRLIDKSGLSISADFSRLVRHLVSRKNTRDLSLVLVMTSLARPWIEGLVSATYLPKTSFVPWEPSTVLSLDGRLEDGLAAKLEQTFHTAGLKDDFDSRNNVILRFSRRSNFDLEDGIDEYEAHRAKSSAAVKAALDLWPHYVKSQRPDPDDEESEKRARLDWGIIRMLAIVAAPIESSVALHHPPVLIDLSRLVPDDNPVKRRWLIDQTFERLASVGIAVKLGTSFFQAEGTLVNSGEFPRYALNRAVMTEVRERLGVPIGNALLSNTFSLSLATSLPVDVIVPAPDIRQRLRGFLENLMGSYPYDKNAPSGQPNADSAVLKEYSSALRAAGNVLRSFFSAASIVTFQPVRIDSTSDSIGNLEEHKQLISNLLSCVRNFESCSKEVGSGNQVQSVLPPFYGGELVWLHNERAAISLIQGDLYEAEFSLKHARKLNREYRGKNGGHHRNRINLNRSLLLIERGKLHDAELLLNQLDAAGKTSEPCERDLIEPIVDGYKAFICQLGGRVDEAKLLYERSIGKCVATNQMRALAIFKMRYSALLFKSRNEPDAKNMIEAAIHAADAASQLDILWRARLQKLSICGYHRTNTLVAEQALAYAQKAGLHRVIVESYMAGAAAAKESLNFELAADLTTHAMIYANRFGMTLRKISLRINMGSFLLAQGQQTGEVLIARAISHADRLGFQSAIQAAHDSILSYRARHPDVKFSTGFTPNAQTIVS
jgi:GTPase SAR1 family protein